MSSLSEKEAYEFFDRYYSGVRSFIRSIVKEDWIAEDLTQETFMRVFKHLPALKDPGRAKPWLFRIAKNLCIDFFRQDKNVDKKLAAPVDPSNIAGSYAMESAMEKQEMSACVKNHFQLLPDNLREVLWLFDAEGFTHKEIAEILGINIANVKVRLHRARKKMKDILNENCRFERDDQNVFICVPNGDAD